MHFKGIEIVGFKSFLNKTKLKFEPGVTAIVGPNGCGKSNIVDAIKWVLGEQSVKSMRSSSMQDVIFNGTDKHEPVNFAEVSLTLSNEDRSLPIDYDEVIISRRLYRSGESEYLLNKMPVRLTDVRDLIMGTGIGTSSYSIVEQGRMDMILSSKPEERRHIFEEASGITRYKAKKREALLKLERTQENLVRINDITREVEKQINSIERKARKAERYKVRYDELKDLEVKSSYKKLKELSANDTSLMTSGDDLKSNITALSSQLKEASSGLLELREEYNAIFSSIQETQSEITRFSSDIDKNEHTIRINEERVQELEKHVERLDWEIEETTERKETLQNRLDGLASKFQDVSKKREEKENEFTAAKEKVEAATGQLEKYRHELKFNREKTLDMAEAETKTKNTLIRMNADMQNTQAREKRLKLERNTVHAEKDNVSLEFGNISEKVQTLEHELEERKAEFQTFNNEYISNQQELSLLSSAKQEKEKRLNEIKPRRQFLEKLIAEREGVNESVKEVMKHAETGDPRFSGVHGILSELINVREDYEESVGSILAEASGALIVDNRAIAERIIKYLEENSMESVNFIILDELERLLREKHTSQAAKVTLDDITHVLAAKEPYKSAVRALLSDTFIAASEEEAQVFIDGNSAFDGRIAGEKGAIYRKGMRRSKNYSQKESIPLFGRREKVDEMLAEEEEISKELKDINAAIENLEEWLKEASSKKEFLETELRKKQMEASVASNRQSAVKEKLDSLTAELLLLNTEIEEEAENLKRMWEEKENLEKSIQEMESENIKVKEAVEEAQRIITDSVHSREKELFHMSDVKADLSAYKKEEENLSENLEREKDICQRIDAEVEGKRSRISENGERIKSLTQEIKTLGERNIEYSASLEVKTRDISVENERKEVLSKTIHIEEGTVREKEQKLELVKDKTRDVDIEKKELEYKREALVNKILDTYKVDIRNLDIAFDENVNWEESANRIDELKMQLERMGEVSLGAVEEHNELKERFEFLSKQRDDLANGREVLLKTITKINRTTRKLFMETFESIRKEFNDYFRMLFNGGKAELVLEDESNVLECGIDIIVRPPGKKLHNIMQLSGGEKAMTAIALIFAIFKVNPSPFCILDEIDAPLDESNIVRFCRVLQEFLKLSQFIIVTHNRMTIQLADILYGITMQEKGVSKIVSVKFAEEKEAPDAETIPSAV